MLELYKIGSGNKFLDKVCERIDSREQGLKDFWSHVKIDISCQLENEFPGWNKMQGNAKTINDIFYHLQNNLDFALKNDDEGYVYFLDDIMLSWHPKKEYLRGVIKIKPKTFENALKLALLGHPIFVSNKALQFNKVYMRISESIK